MEKGASCRVDVEGETEAAAALDGVVGEDFDDPVDSLTGSLGHLRNASLTTKAVIGRRGAEKDGQTLFANSSPIAKPLFPAHLTECR